MGRRKKKGLKFPPASQVRTIPRIVEVPTDADGVVAGHRKVTYNLQLARVRNPQQSYVPSWFDVILLPTDIQIVFAARNPYSTSFDHAVVIKMSHQGYLDGLWRVCRDFSTRIDVAYHGLYASSPKVNIELSESTFPMTWRSFASNLVRMAQAGTDFIIDFLWLPPTVVAQAVQLQRGQINENMVEPVLRIQTDIVQGWNFLERCRIVASEVESVINYKIPTGGEV